MGRDETSDALRTAETIAGACIGARVRTLSRAVSRIYDERLREHGIKFSQMNILTLVTVRGPVQPSEIAELLSLEKSTLSRNVRILETNGWLESRPGPAGNTRLLTVTAAGRRLLRRASTGWRAAQKEVAALLGERDLAAIRRAFDSLQRSGNG